MITRRHAMGLAGAAVLAPVFVGRALAQTWPTRIVRLVAPFPPGGGTDAVSRIIGARLSELWASR